ncbi:MAG TPA: long-chain fatty acid--CoA ligase [bacterium]|nr:long-chain fatty acid--CoA ligase [bacterium]
MAYQLDYLETLPAVFTHAVSNFRDMPLYALKSDDGFDYLTYQEVYSTIEEIGMGLHSLGYREGDRIAILSENKPEWIMTDYACAYFGIVSVPVYPTLLPNQISYILNDSQASLIFVSNRAQAETIMEIKDKLPALQQMIIYDENHGLIADWIMDFTGLTERGRQYKSSATFSLAEKGQERTGDDLWTILYTSGTTGMPKGVMLSQFNIASNFQAAQAALNFESGRRWLSFLPFSHSLERVAAHMCIYIGSAILVIESIETVLDDIQAYKPHYFVSVPRLYEKIYHTVLQQVHTGSAVKRRIFNWATKIGNRVSGDYLQRGKSPSGILAWQYGLAHKLVFSKITRLFGGEALLTISGGAPLSKDIGQFFASAGLIIAEGFGLTEMSPVTNANRPDRIKFGTVGPALPDVEIRIADDGEILFNGPNRMQGYYNNPEATAEVIDEEGWLHSGDIGEIDEDGHLVITDRKKNIIVTSGGKNVAPAPLESRIAGSPYVEQVMALGDQRKYIAALIVPNQEALEYWAKSNGLYFEDYQDLLQKEEVNALLDHEVQQAQADLPSFEQIKRTAIIETPFTQEGGELTPTLKIKRRVVEEKYQDLINGLYPDD